MKYSIFSYLVGEGVHNVLKNKKSTGAALMIMIATMLIFGVFFIIGENVNYIMKEIESQQGMQVFIENETSESDTLAIREKIKAIEGVNTVEYISKQEAVNQMKDKLGEKQNLIAGYEKLLPFPASYLVTLTDLSMSTQVQEKILELDNIKNIQSRDQTISALIGIANGVKIVSGIILVLLVIISVFIIANTIKLTVHARRKEISIMKYVGATNGFIRWPFIVEGIIIGIVAALISILILGMGYNLITQKILASSLTKLVSISLLSFSDLFNLVIIVYLGLGIGIGAIGSAISMKKYLEV